MDLFANEARLLRERGDALEARLGRLAAAGAGGTHRMVGRVFSQGAIPTTAGKFYACHPVTVTGPVTEGSTPVKTVDTGQAFLVDLLAGSAAVGDDLVCRRVRHRWVARRKATASCVVTVTVRGCNPGAAQLLPGATVEARQSGVLVASGTTNSVGVVVLTVPRAASTAITTSKARFSNGLTGGATTGATATFGSTMTAATGYSCQDPSGCGTLSKVCPDPLANTLTLTLPSGTKTLTHAGSQWTFQETRSGAKFAYASFGCDLSYSYCVLGSGLDPTCLNPLSFAGPSSFTADLPISCPAAGLLISGTITSPYDSGSWSITE
jgi:hypothetical protein